MEPTCPPTSSADTTFLRHDYAGDAAEVMGALSQACESPLQAVEPSCPPTSSADTTFLRHDYARDAAEVMGARSTGLPPSSSLREKDVREISRSPRHVSWWKPFSSAATVVEAANDVVKRLQDQVCLRWLDEGGNEERCISYRGMWERAGTVAHKLLHEYGARKGDRVLLCYTPGIECMVSIWACLRAGVIGVPVYPPNPSKLNSALKKIEFVREACGAEVCLLDTAIARLRMVSRITQTWPRMRYHNTEREAVSVQGSEFSNGQILPSDIAYLQFTSGTTGDPKGVTISHKNLWSQLNDVFLPLERHLLAMKGVDPTVYKDQVGVTWLPQYHDMGLVCSHMASFLAGFTVIGTSPLSFLRNPLLWLQAMSRYKASRTAAPNFSYGLAAKRLAKLSAEEKAALSLDLSALLYCGDAAERVRREVLAEFQAACAPFGFRGVHAAGYGLAEHVASVCWSLDPRFRTITAAPPRSHLISVGCLSDSTVEVRIVDPTSLQRLPDGTAGEIWLCSPSVAVGYWGQSELSAAVFGNQLVGDEGRRFLRTGDEGFVEDGHLYVCGRIKDMIVVRGRNFYAEDVEAAVIAAAPELARPNCAAAFALEGQDEEQLGIVFEVYDGKERIVKQTIASIVAGVTAEADIRPHRVVAIKARSIPKTTSGKLQRKATRTALLAGRLSVLYDSAAPSPPVSSSWRSLFKWKASTPSKKAVSHQPEPGMDARRANNQPRGGGRWADELRRLDAFERRETIAKTIRAEVERVTGRKAMDDQVSWGEAGMDSMDSIRLSNALQQHLGNALTLGSTALFEYPCVSSLAHHIDYRLFDAPRDGLSAAIGGGADGERQVLQPATLQVISGSARGFASCQQEQMYILQSTNPEGCAYNVTMAFKVKGVLRLDLLQASIKSVMDRNESLRTSFVESQPASSNGHVLQVVASGEDVRVPFREHLVGCWAEAEALLRKAARTPFDMSCAPLFRIEACQQADGPVYYLGLTLHHSIVDGASMILLLQQIGRAYDSLFKFRPLPAAPTAGVQATAYASWQRTQLLSHHNTADLKAYWKTALPTCPVLDLPTDFARPACFGGVDGFAPISVAPALVARLKQICHSHRCTLFHALVASYGLVLGSMSNATELIVGCPYANRHAVDIEKTLGCFVSTLPLLIRLEGTVQSYLAEIKRRMVGAIEHAALPLSEIASTVGADRDPSHPTLVQTTFTFYGKDWFQGENGLQLHNTEVEPLWGLQEGMDSRFEMSLFLEETAAGALVGGLQFATTLYDRVTAVAVTERFQQTLASFTHTPGQAPVSDVDWLTVQDRETLATLSKEKPLASPLKGDTLLDIWNCAVEASAGAVAVVTADEETTYAILDERSSQLAAALRSRVGVKPRDFVGLCVEPSTAVVVCILAILKCGAAYVPIDPDVPERRALDTVRDAGMRAVVCQEGLCEQLLVQCMRPRLTVNSAGSCVEDEKAGRHVEVHLQAGASSRPSKADPCYMIFTSGSTGRPKGCVLHHGGVVHFLKSSLAINGLRAQDRNLMSQSYAFDASVKILWYAICSGSSVVIPSRGDLLNDLPATAARFQCTIVSGTPTLIAVAAESPTALKEAGVRSIFVCGEAVSEEFINKFAGELRVINGYGPTEAAVNVTMIVCKPGARYPRSIGPPLDGLRCYVVDTMTNRQQPIGVPGELWVSGEQVALGYHNRPELNARSFPSNPFLGDSETEQSRGRFARVYKTGDHCRHLPDGTIEFLGRRDTQVKVRGYRVELGEIENCLQQVCGVSDSVVVFRPETETLAAYVVPACADTHACRQHLQLSLPQYMLPSTITALPSFPRNVNNKVDFSKLPRLDPSKAVPSAARSEDATQDDMSGHITHRHARQDDAGRTLRVLEVFQQVLLAPELRAHDNLFHFGLTSLSAVRATRALRERHLADWAVTSLLQHQTVESCCTLLGLLGTEVDDTPRAENEAVCIDIAGAQGGTDGLHGRDVPQVEAGGWSQNSWAVMAVQAAAIVLLYAWLGLCCATPCLSLAFWAFRHGEYGSLVAVLFSVCGLVIGMCVMAGSTILAKWLVLGRQRPGRVALWSGAYLRWWVVSNLVRAAQTTFLWIFQETFVLNWWCRLLGARIGEGVCLRTLQIFDHDLITIHDNAMIDEDAAVMAHCITPGTLVLCAVEIGAGCVVSPYSHVGPTSDCQHRVDVPEQVVLHPHTSAARKQWCSAPCARQAKIGTPIQLLAVGTASTVLGASTVPSLVLSQVVLRDTDSLSKAAFLMTAGLLLTCVSYSVLFIVVARALRCAPVTRQHRRFLIRALCRPPPFQALFALSFTPIVTWVLRALGAKVGKRCLLTFPRGLQAFSELEIGSDVFTGGYLRLMQDDGVPENDLSKGKIRLGDAVSVTNHVVIKSGAVLHDGCTIGDMTVVDSKGDFDGATVTVGEVRFPTTSTDGLQAPRGGLTGVCSVLAALASLCVVPGCAALSLVLLGLVGHRIEDPRVAAVFYPAWEALKEMDDASPGTQREGHYYAGLFVGLLAVATMLLSCLVVVALKWCCVRRFRAGAEIELESLGFELWHLHLRAVAIVEYVFLEAWKGSEWICVFCRLMGAQVGSDVSMWLSLSNTVEFDLYRFQDSAVLNRGCQFQGHAHSRRSFQFGSTTVGTHTTIHANASLLPGGVVEPRATIQPCSLVLSGEVVRGGEIWAGVPATKQSICSPQPQV